MIQARSGVALAVPACLTVQNRSRFDAVQPVSADLFSAMVRAALEDGAVSAIKTGLLGDAAVVEHVAELLREPCDAGVPLVVDPVLAATVGGFAPGDELVEAYLRCLVPLASVVTPNLPEMERLAEQGPQALLALGSAAVLVKGGHGDGDVVEDRLHSQSGEVVFRHPRLAVGPVRGTGCALASAVACGLGAGLGIEEACRGAVATLTRCLGLTSASVDGGPALLAID